MRELEECNVALTLAIGGGGGDRLGPETKKTAHALFPARPRIGERLFDEEPSTTVEDRRRSERQPGISVVAKQEEEASDGGGCGNGDGRRKKLRLSEEQLALLEDNFRAHTTLTPDQKQDLALRLDLQPRQVEVWFQNRRARTKLKQIEVDCEFLKKLCEGLRSENRRLKRELLELRSSAPAKLGGLPLFTELRKAARVRVCSSCDKTASAAAADDEKKRAAS